MPARNNNRIEIEKLDGLEFKSYKIESDQIRIEAVQTESHLRNACPTENCNGVLTTHGVVKSTYEDISMDGKRVFIDAYLNRYYCPVCGSTFEFKPDSISRDTSNNHRFTNRYIDWIEFLCAKYGVNYVSELLDLKPRRLYYIQSTYQETKESLLIDVRGVFVLKSRREKKTIFLLIDMRTKGLFDYVYDAKDVIKVMKRLKDGCLSGEHVSAVIPATFKYSDELIELLGEEYVSYDYRSIRSLISLHCFQAYKAQMREDKQIFEPSIEEQEVLFCSRSSALTDEQMKALNHLLEHNETFHLYYYLQSHQNGFVEVNKINFKKRKTSLPLKKLDEKIDKINNNFTEYSQEAILDEIQDDVWNGLKENYRKEWIILKNSDKKFLLDKFIDFDKSLIKK